MTHQNLQIIITLRVNATHFQLYLIRFSLSLLYFIHIVGLESKQGNI